MASSSQAAKPVDVLIAGAGIVGLALAVALRQALGPSFSVTVADPGLARPRDDARATAIVAAARRLFETMGVWDLIASQPILDMVVTDSTLQDTVRPTFLTFAGEIEPGEPFGHMVENAPLIAALLAKARDDGVALLPVAVRDSRLASSHRMGVELADGEMLSAALLIGADGAHSAIRERAGIAVHGWSYGQSAIIATIAHERDHCGRAEEHFLPAGPFAILPLTGRRSSIVWTEEKREAQRIVGLPDDEFHAEVERRFGLGLGEIRSGGPAGRAPAGPLVRARLHWRADRAGWRCRSRDPSHCRAGSQYGSQGRGCAGRSHCRCRAART